MSSTLMSLIAFLLLAQGTACTHDRLVLIPEREIARSPPEIRKACALAEDKCSRCHDLERIKIAHHAMVDWPVYVDRMRRLPGSGISQGDGKIILQCLDHLKRLQQEAEMIER